MGSINSRETAEDTEQFHSPETHNEGRPLLARYFHSDSGVPRPFPTAPVTALVKEARYCRFLYPSTRQRSQRHQNDGPAAGEAT